MIFRQFISLGLFATSFFVLSETAIAQVKTVDATEGNRVETAGCDTAAFWRAVTGTRANPKTIRVTCVIPVTSGKLIPKNITLVFDPGGRFDISAESSLEIRGSIHAGPNQIFSGKGRAFGRLQTSYPEWFGAKGDGIVLEDGSMPAGSNVLTSSSAKFRPEDAGKLIKVPGAGGGPYRILGATISNVTDANHVTLNVSATNEVSGAEVTYASDDLDGIEAAFAMARTVKFSQKTYGIRRAIDNPSKSSAIGTGPSSVIFNPCIDAKPPYWAGFMLGNQHPAAFKYDHPSMGEFAVYDCGPVQLNETTISGLAGAERNLSPGDFVWIRHRDEISFSGARYPLWAQLNKVVRVNTSSHSIVVENPMREQISNACVSPAQGRIDPFMKLPWRVVENARIENLTIDARAAVSTRTGAYRCTIRKIWVRNAESQLSINAFEQCQVEDIIGDFKGRQLEIKMYSGKSTFRNCAGSYVGYGTNQTTIEIAEQSSDILLDHVTSNTGPEANDAGAETGKSGLKINGRRNVVRNCTIRYSASVKNSSAVSITGNNFTGYGPADNVIEDCRFQIGSNNQIFLVDVGSENATENPVQTHWVRNVMVGSPASGYSIRFAHGSGDKLDGNNLPLGVTIGSKYGRKPLIIPRKQSR